MVSELKKRTYVYIYILGDDNEWNYISTFVPFKINNKEIFFGPCKKPIRQKLRKKILKKNKNIYLEDNDYEIYIIGINPAKKDDIRKFLFAAKITEIFTFQYAWHYYHERAEIKHDQDVRNMINGREGKSPLHLKPIPINKNAKLIGYEHYLHLHDGDWIEDITSKKLNKVYYNQIIKKNYIEKKFKNIELEFNRDCCFSAENIFLSLKKEILTISLDDTFLKYIKNGFMELNKKNKMKSRLITNGGPTLKAPFGFSKKPKKPGEFEKYGRGFLTLEGEFARDFIKYIYKRKNLKG